MCAFVQVVPPPPPHSPRREVATPTQPLVTPLKGDRTVSGMVIRLDRGTVTLRTRFGEETLLLRADTLYQRDGLRLDAASLSVNDRVSVRTGRNLDGQAVAYQVIWGDLVASSPKTSWRRADLRSFSHKYVASARRENRQARLQSRPQVLPLSSPTTSLCRQWVVTAVAQIDGARMAIAWILPFTIRPELSHGTAEKPQTSRPALGTTSHFARLNRLLRLTWRVHAADDGSFCSPRTLRLHRRK